MVNVRTHQLSKLTTIDQKRWINLIIKKSTVIHKETRTAGQFTTSNLYRPNYDSDLDNHNNNNSGGVVSYDEEPLFEKKSKWKKEEKKKALTKKKGPKKKVSEEIKSNLD